ncbi:MAG: hypothetical protein HUK40_24125 [Desulfobacter sp.]|nr:hypothetical protein [Desulfobacter sp.]WDP88130.1 MAG: hypothetical protein HUN05_18280 [Desulfobacter sp.]
MAALIKEQTGIVAELVPGANGIYEIVANDTLVFSKHASGRFPEDKEIMDQLLK